MSKDVKPDGQSEVKLKSLHVGIPEAFHRRVKMLCVIKGQTLKDYVSAAVEEKVARDEADLKKGGREAK